MPRQGARPKGACRQRPEDAGCCCRPAGQPLAAARRSRVVKNALRDASVECCEGVHALLRIVVEQRGNVPMDGRIPAAPLVRRHAAFAGGALP